MACRGDVDTEDVNMVAQVARSGEFILCGYLKNFEHSMSSDQKEKVIAAMDFFETLANHLETLTVAVEDMNYREEMCECGTITATGETVHVGGAACNFLPFGTVVVIDGVEYIVNDRCGIDNCIDIFMESYEDAIQFGRQHKEVYIKR